MKSKFNEEEKGITDRGLEGREEVVETSTEAVSVEKFHPKNFEAIPNHALRNAADLLILYGGEDDLEFGVKARNDIAGRASSYAEYVTDPDKLPEILNKYALISNLIISTHGTALNSGNYLAFRDGNIYDFTWDFWFNTKMLPGSRGLFADNAKVLFESCLVGKGKNGDDFLEKAGKALLFGTGGLVGAATTQLYGLAPLGIFLTDIQLPIWGELKIFKFDVQGNVVDRKEFG